MCFYSGSNVPIYHNNRATVHFKLENYGTAEEDATYQSFHAECSTKSFLNLILLLNLFYIGSVFYDLFYFVFSERLSKVGSRKGIIVGVKHGLFSESNKVSSIATSESSESEMID